MEKTITLTRKHMTFLVLFAFLIAAVSAINYASSQTHPKQTHPASEISGVDGKQLEMEVLDWSYFAEGPPKCRTISETNVGSTRTDDFCGRGNPNEKLVGGSCYCGNSPVSTSYSSLGSTPLWNCECSNTEVDPNIQTICCNLKAINY